MTSSAFWSGITAFLFIAFGALTLQISVIEQFDITTAEAESWITVTWLTTVLASLALTAYLKQPIAIAWSIPAIVFMGGLAGSFSFEEFAAANLVTGIVLLGLSVTGGTTRILRFLPLPILMGMFAGTILVFITRMVEATADDFALVGPMVGAYLLGRFLNRQRVPPVGLAVVVGAVLVLALGRTTAPDLEWGAPSLVVPAFDFSWEAIVSISLPMVILVLGLGNAPGLAFLSAQGYRVSTETLSAGAGVSSVVNALFGGSPNALTAIVTALIGGPDAGALEKRYWAAVVAWVPSLSIALSAALIVSAVAVLPPAYIAAVAGLAILSAFEDALARAFGGRLRFGAVIAFCVTLSSFEVAGLPPALWALAAGVLASAATEFGELSAQWRSDQPEASAPSPTESASWLLKIHRLR